MSEKIVTTVRLPKFIDDWIVGRVDCLGVSKNAIVIMALEEYINQRTAINELNNVNNMMQQIGELQNQLKK